MGMRSEGQSSVANTLKSLMRVDLAECDPATVKMDGCNDVMNESRQLVSLNVLEMPINAPKCPPNSLQLGG